MTDISRLECPRVNGLDANEQQLLVRCYNQWMKHQARNLSRLAYYKSKVPTKPLAIRLTAEIDNAVKGVSGWGHKCVDTLASLSQFDTFVFAGEVEDDLIDIVRECDLVNAYNAAVTSQLLFGCTFVSVTKGMSYEPRALVHTHSALNASGVWDNRLHRLIAGLTLVDADENGQPTAMNLYTDDAVIELYKTTSGTWSSQRHSHNIGRCLMEVMRYRPITDVNPMGRSRITEAAMNIIDRAQEEIRLTAIASQFNALPQKYLLGVDSDFFENNSKWEAYYGSILAISRGKNGDVPQFGQLSQGSMQPHIEVMRQYACEFASETSLPISALGVVQDNPSSAEAMLCAKDELITEARLLNNGNTLPMRNIGLMVLATIRGCSIDALEESEASCMPHFLDPMNYSPSINADFAVKYASIDKNYAQTRVCKERVGFSNEEIMRMESDIRREQSKDAVNRLMEEAMIYEGPAEETEAATA